MNNIEDERTDENKIYSYQKMLFRYKYARRFLIKGNVLDVGCGYGYGARLLNKFNYIGIDYYDKAIKFASKTHPSAKFIQMKIPSIKFPDCCFDNVICAEIIEHMPENKGKILLKEINRVLKQKGVMFLSTPNFDNRKKIMANHTIEYGSKQLRKMVKDAGFKIVHKGGLSLSFMFGWKYYPKWLKRWYDKSSTSKQKMRAKKEKSLKEKTITSLGKIGIKISGKLMLYLGYLFPKKAEYQILICRK